MGYFICKQKEMVQYTTVILIIYWLVYLIYIVSALMDFDLTSISEETFIWIIAYTLMIMLFMTCVLCTLHIDGLRSRMFFNMNVSHFIIIIVGLVILIGLILYYRQWNMKRTWNDIKKKLVNKNFHTFVYQYGRDSEEIGRRLHITDDEVFPRHNTKSLEEIWETIMIDTNTKIKTIIRKILKEDLRDGIDINYNLLWYLCISENPLGSNLTDNELKYVTLLSPEELEQLLGANYNGAHDRASLLFAVISGYSVPDPGILPRYDTVKSYKSNIIYNLAFNQYKIIDHNTAIYNLYPPHIYISQQPISPIETIISNINIDDCDELIEKLGLGFNENLLNMTNNDKMLYIQGELSLYYNVLTRPEGLILPPSLNGLTHDQIRIILSYYTNNELIEAYEPREQWSTRNELLNIIYDDITGMARWSFSHRYCTNDNTINVLSGDQHADINKDDFDDPTLSYGIHKNYRCYQASELEASFRDYDGTFMFRIPDWTQDATDETTQLPLMREFPLESIKQLQTLLETATNIGPMIYNVNGLLNKIKEGREILQSGKMQTLYLKRQYDEFNPEQQRIIYTYMAWMFMYSMWMRFWKGPGYPWPMNKVNVQRERDRIREQRSSPQERDEHIFVQEAVRTIIIESFENDIVLSEWINKLPASYYDFDTNESKYASYPIKQTLDQIALGNFCMGFGSDTILKTSYHYIINVLDIKPGDIFNEFINGMLPIILDIEYQVVMNQLHSIHTNTDRMHVLNARLQALQQPLPRANALPVRQAMPVLPIQPPFHPANYQNNTHVD